MLKELKYFLYTITILGFIFFTANYYFSDENKKKFYRSSKVFDIEVAKYIETLDTLESDTENIIDYVENSIGKDKKKYKFWELIIGND